MIKIAPKPLKLTIGSDPEVMLREVATGEIVSSIPILKNTKDDPIDLGDGIKTYSDCVLAEATMPYVMNVDQLVERFRNVFQRMQKHVGKKYTLLGRSSHVYSPAQLKDKRAWEIGCNPELLVHQKTITQPREFADGTRTGSAHWHLGNLDWQNDPQGKLISMRSAEEAVKLMDIFVGCSTTIYDKDPTARARRKLYGICGSFRKTPFGCEYRVCGGGILNTPDFIRLTGDLIIHAMSHISNDTAPDVFKKVDFEEVQKAVNENDPILSRKILRAAELPAKLMARVEQNYKVPALSEAWGLEV